MSSSVRIIAAFAGLSSGKLAPCRRTSARRRSRAASRAVRLPSSVTNVSTPGGCTSKTVQRAYRQGVSACTVPYVSCCRQADSTFPRCERRLPFRRVGPEQSCRSADDQRPRVAAAVTAIAELQAIVRLRANLIQRPFGLLARRTRHAANGYVRHGLHRGQVARRPRAPGRWMWTRRRAFAQRQG